MIPNAYSDIKTKDADRQHLNDAVAQFLATGGKVDNLSPPPAASQAVAKAAPGPRPATTAPAADPSGERRAASGERQERIDELRAIRAAAAALHRRLDGIEQQLNSLPAVGEAPCA